ncbi:MAG: RND transporter, partial [Deltaproteobacteria bacterium]|nr:RND transporter [Deltaproteobacteria bacterium]
MSRWVQRVVIVVIAMGVLGAGATWYLKGRNGQTMIYRTVPVKRGDLLVSISATGTVEPEEVIDVGAQIAGQIMAFGKDAGG